MRELLPKNHCRWSKMHNYNPRRGCSSAVVAVVLGGRLLLLLLFLLEMLIDATSIVGTNLSSLK